MAYDSALRNAVIGVERERRETTGYEPADWNEVVHPTAEREGNNLKGVKDFRLKNGSSQGPNRPYMCHIRSTSADQSHAAENERSKLPAASSSIQGYLAHKKHPPPWDHHRSLGIGLL